MTLDEIRKLCEAAESAGSNLACCRPSDLRKLLAVAEKYRQARATLITAPLLHGDAAHRIWLTRTLTEHFAAVDEALAALEAP